MELQHGVLARLISDRFANLFFGPFYLFCNVETDKVDVVFGLPTRWGGYAKQEASSASYRKLHSVVGIFTQPW